MVSQDRRHLFVTPAVQIAEENISEHDVQDKACEQVATENTCYHDVPD